MKRLLWAALCVAGALWSAPPAAAAVRLGGAEPSELPMLRLVLGFALCATLALVGALMLRRLMQKGFSFPASIRGGAALLGAPARQLCVYETVRLSASAEACRMGWGERHYLVVIAGASVTLLDSKPSKMAEPSP